MQLGEERVHFILHFRVKVQQWECHFRSSRQELKQRPWRNVAYQLALSGQTIFLGDQTQSLKSILDKDSTKWATLLASAIFLTLSEPPVQGRPSHISQKSRQWPTDVPPTGQPNGSNFSMEVLSSWLHTGYVKLLKTMTVLYLFPRSCISILFLSKYLVLGAGHVAQW